MLGTLLFASIAESVVLIVATSGSGSGFGSTERFSGSVLVAEHMLAIVGGTSRTHRTMKSRYQDCLLRGRISEGSN